MGVLEFSNPPRVKFYIRYKNKTDEKATATGSINCFLKVPFSLLQTLFSLPFLFCILQFLYSRRRWLYSVCYILLFQYFYAKLSVFMYVNFSLVILSHLIQHLGIFQPHFIKWYSSDSLFSPLPKQGLSGYSRQKQVLISGYPVSRVLFNGLCPGLINAGTRISRVGTTGTRF